MTEIKPGDKFKIRHGNHGGGESVWSGPYVCEGHRSMLGLIQITYTDDGIKFFIQADKCVKVEDEKMS